jgi:hypothetical protein
MWLTGYRSAQLKRAIDTKVDFEGFFKKAPRIDENMELITGVVCGVRVEEIDDPVIRKARCLDKVIDELAKGKSLEKILRK